ncbi:MAG: hypothetical protein K5675_06115 [Lachnospiraceae bacterium]|nr:hypothetical protein [Lachnospiraceae bacterium]
MSRKKEKKSALPVLLGVLAALVVIACVLYFVVWTPLKSKVVDTVAEKAITNVAEQAGVDASAATEIYDSMSEEDKATVQDMIEEHADAETVQKAVDLYKNGDTAALKDMAQSELSDEEINELVDLYQKYVN